MGTVVVVMGIVVVVVVVVMLVVVSADVPVASDDLLETLFSSNEIKIDL